MCFWRLNPLLLRTQSGGFNLIDLEMCNKYWMDGYLAALMAEQMSRVLGRELHYMIFALKDTARQWT